MEHFITRYAEKYINRHFILAVATDHKEAGTIRVSRRVLEVILGLKEGVVYEFYIEVPTHQNGDSSSSSVGTRLIVAKFVIT
jgi:hypothetical protein